MVDTTEHGASAESMDAYNAWRASQGLPTFEVAPPVPEGVKTPKRPHFLNLTDEAWEGLKVVAYEAGFTAVTPLIEAIGTRRWPE